MLSHVSVLSIFLMTFLFLSKGKANEGISEHILFFFNLAEKRQSRTHAPIGQDVSAHFFSSARLL